MDDTDLFPSRLDAAKDASMGYVEQLRDACPQACVSVISYSDDARIECRNLEVSERFEKIRRRIEKLQIRGCTDIGRALKTTARTLERARSSRIQLILLTDGHHNGNVDPEPVADRLKHRLNARIDCVGIGRNHRSVDERLLKRIASLDEKNRPRYHFIKDSLRLVEHFRHLAGYLTTQ
jgi:Mg-chelatase subunit ChlD